MNKIFKAVIIAIASIMMHTTNTSFAQTSVARQWNEVILEAIRNDFARPTVHARNLFHTSVAMYDSWAVYDLSAETYFLGKTVNGFNSEFSGIPAQGDIDSLTSKTLSYAIYRIMDHRFANSPGFEETKGLMDSLMSSLNYDTAYSSTDYSSGNHAALGNYLASQIIDYGLGDNSNEQNNYENTFYESLNPTLAPIVDGNPDIIYENNWQPLTLDVFIDQAGVVFPISTPEFLSPEWGTVYPFALEENDLTINTDSEGNDYWLYHDPSSPPLLDINDLDIMAEYYEWGFTMVSAWSSHHDPLNNQEWDISPASIGNVQNYPSQYSDYPDFYNYYEGGDSGSGHDTNPANGLPYEPQYVKRSDYTRILAEFWADGPDSETPPGHWFTILNYVSDQPIFEKRFEGMGPVLSDLEWDVKSYFTLGAAMHDAAVAVWGCKGWYDYIRPISAIRFLGSELGQSTSDTLPSYHEAGIKLREGFVELVDTLDPLIVITYDTLSIDTVWVGKADFELIYLQDTVYKNLNKIKLYAWKGPDYISNPETDAAGVDWILADDWWPYQRPTFVTPPFAGYVSGHSTFSRSAAEVMTLITGDEFFPGGMGEFFAPMNEFLVFEEGPSTDVTLQWATYYDASDQCSLSRIWGGIHPPADDIPGRLMGMVIGPDAFDKAKELFQGAITNANTENRNEITVYPNPVMNSTQINSSGDNLDLIKLLDGNGREILNIKSKGKFFNLNLSDLPSGMYFLEVETVRNRAMKKLVKL
jgi:hypothetical protein